MDQALTVELNQQPARYQLSNLTMFTEFNSTDDYYYLKAEQESWDEENEAARQVARLEKKVEELDEINKRQARQITEEQAAARRLEKRVEELGEANERQQARAVELEQLEGEVSDLKEAVQGLKRALKEAHEEERASHRVIGQKDEELARLKEKLGAYATLERVLQRDLVSPTNSIEVVNEMEDQDGGFTVLKK
jgi:chromosome segregation ATPase